MDKLKAVFNFFRPFKRAKTALNTASDELGKELDTFKNKISPLQDEIDSEFGALQLELERLDARLQTAIAAATPNQREIDRVEASHKKLMDREKLLKEKVTKFKIMNDAHQERSQTLEDQLEKAYTNALKWLVIGSTGAVFALILLATFLSTEITGTPTNRIAMSYYEALAQIFPVLLIALFVSPSNKSSSSKAIASKWVLIAKNSKHLGLLGAAIGEFACLSALATQSSYIWMHSSTTAGLCILATLLVLRVVEGEANN